MSPVDGLFAEVTSLNPCGQAEVEVVSYNSD